MQILDDSISSLSGDSVVREVYSYVFWTAVVSKHCGLASTFREEHPHHGIVRGAGDLRNTSALELAQYARAYILDAGI